MPYLVIYLPSGDFQNVTEKENKLMCITPSEISVLRGPTWEQIPVPCGSCWRCKANRVNDFVGRSLCEAQYSDWVVTLTLTYAPRVDLADKILTPRHFQDFIRSLRDAHHSIRYLAVGEYGSLRGRSHFHCILFGKGKKPDYPQKKNFHIKTHWPHGHAFADWDMDEKAIRYVCKYLLGNSKKGDYWFTLSKKPPLGAEFFAHKAAENVRLGVFPNSFEYYPPNGDKGRPYLMSRATRRDYLAAIYAAYKTFGAPYDVTKMSEWVRKVFDKETLNSAVKLAEKWEKTHANEAFDLFKAEIQERQNKGRSATSYQLQIDREISGMSSDEHRHFLADIGRKLDGS